MKHPNIHIQRWRDHFKYSEWKLDSYRTLFVCFKPLLDLLQYCLCFMFWSFDHEACGILALLPEIKPTSPAGVLTTGLPGKSLTEYFKISKLHSCHHHFALRLSWRSQFSNSLALQTEKTSQTHGRSPRPPFSCSRLCLGRLAEPQVEMLRDVSRSTHWAF